MGSDQKATKLNKQKQWGGKGGKEWKVEEALFASFNLTKIAIRSGDIVDRFEFCYKVNEKDQWYGMDNGVGGRADIIQLDESKHITTMEGYYNYFAGNIVVITWLKFKDSNGKSYGPYGKKTDGTHFIVSPKNEKIVGFHGRGGYFLDAIGVYTRVMPRKTIMLKEWGGDSGTPWDMDDVVNNSSTRLTKIIIRYGDLINSIEYNYEVNGEQKPSGRKGGLVDQQNENAVVREDWFELGSDEHINGISGYYAPTPGTTEPILITQLKFYTNKHRMFGPYGLKRGTHFSISAGDTGKIVGFHGGFGKYLDALGVYMAPN